MTIRPATKSIMLFFRQTMQRTTLIVCIALLSALSAVAADCVLQMKRFTVEQGLSNSNITALMQDHNGFVWVGTTNGLNCFDGYRFKVYRRDPSQQNTICGNSIKCLYEDREHNIWIGSLDGLVSKFDTKTESFTTYKCSFPMEVNKGDVSSITQDSKGRIWIMVDRLGMVLLTPATGDMKRYRTKEGTQNTLNHNAITDVVIDRNDNLFMTTWGGGLNVFNTKKESFCHYMTECDGQRNGKCSHMMGMIADHAGRYWFATTHAGFIATDRSMKQLYHFTADGGPMSVGSEAGMCLLEDDSQRIWLGSSVGLSVFSPKDGSLKRVRNADTSFASAEVITMMKDRDGSVWVGTTTGLYVYSPRFEMFGLVRIPGVTSEPGSAIAVLKDKRNRVWLRDKEHWVRFEGSESGRLGAMPSGQGTVTDLNRYMDGKQVKSIYEDSRGRVWIGNFNDVISCYDPQTDSFREIKLNDAGSVTEGGLLPLRTVNAFYEDRDGSIWIACEVGLARLDASTHKIISLIRCRNLIYPDEKCLCLLRDSKGLLWVGTAGGLRCYDKGLKLLKIYNPKEGNHNSLRSSETMALCEGADGTIWVGTSSGLHRYDRKEDNFTFVTRSSQNLGDPIMSIFEDKVGRLWMSSSVGVMEYDTKKGVFQIYDRNDGLQAGEFNKGVGWMMSDGEILFGGARGVNSFRPKDVSPRHQGHKVRLQELYVYNEPLAPGDDSPLTTSIVETDCVELSYDQSTISLQFGCIDFISPQKILYAYMMEKVDNDWIYTTSENRLATYANLSPGTYFFCVKATSTDGSWDDSEVTRIKIVIQPPFWRTWWAYMFYAAALAMLIYGVISYYTEREKTKARMEMERVVAQQQHEMDELKLQVFANISHEFRTSLTLILSPLEFILSHPKPTADAHQILQIMHRNALRLMRLINQLLDFRKSESGQLELNATTQDIVAFVSDVYDTFVFDAQQRGLELTFRKDVEHLVMDFDCDKMDKILYNLLSNAMKYTDAGGHVELSVSMSKSCEETIIIRVKDDGIGIDAKDEDAIFRLFYQSMAADGKFRGGSGLGLNMTREMVRLHGGDITVDSSVGKGSCFVVTLPVRKTDITREDIIECSADNAILMQAEDVADKTLGRKPSGKVILVVEDNPDMREYITRVLSPYYRVETAENGADGLTKAAEVMPDIIISDLMMPKMDGIEMLQTLKKDSKIGHIPVVMLTAVSDEQTVIRSLQTGVDEYVTKPFRASVLKARMDNIIARSSERQQVTEYKDTYISPFIEHMKLLIRKNMSNPELNVEWLAEEMKMSSSQLTRKTKMLIDTTPYRIVIQTRMEEAVTLMKTTDMNVTEIAYRCGYQEISNFSRSFTSYWKESPASYIKKVRTNA